jgi:hypothetical protein
MVYNDHKYHWLSGDINYKDYGGRWYRKEDDHLFTVIEMVNMDNACGDTSHGKYLCIVNEVSIDDPIKNADALNCCGVSLTDAMDNIELLIDSLVSYGSNTICSNYSNNFNKLLKWGKRV